MKKIAVLLDDLVNEQEFIYPYYRLQEAGYEAVSVATENRVHKGKNGVPFTPDAVIGKLNRAMLESMNDPAIRQKLEGAGLRIVSKDRATPQYLDGFVKSEIDKWAGPIKAIGVQID